MEEYPFLNRPYAFTVCRIEPENNLHLILEAFSEHPEMPLVIVGNWKFSSYGRDLFQKYSKLPDYHLLSPIYEKERLNKLRSQCTFYLHGHSCGGTNPSLVEAMYWGLPVIAYDVNFNRETTENKAMYFDTPEALRRLCTETSDEERIAIGKSMQEIAQRRYTWKRIADCYAKLF